MVKVAFSPSVMGELLVDPKMPSSQPVRMHQSTYTAIVVQVAYAPGKERIGSDWVERTSNDSSDADWSDQIATTN